ncbi:MAG: ankyrin repeat domain-containing protein [Cyanobacteria bacterium MAG CAR3_bin_5]|nr:ankyrin repeat domain-containing protein [Cyanobacteria bacterium MAG CAR3_bin_5]
MLNLPKRIRPAPVALPLATVLAFILPLTTACSGRGQQASSPPAQATEAPRQEPVEQASSTGNGVDPAQPLLAIESSPPAPSHLHRAAMAGDVEQVKQLLEQAYDADDIQQQHARGLSALHEAVRRGHGEVVQVFMEAGADPNDPTSRGETPLHLAAETGSVEMCNILLAAGARSDNVDQDGASVMDVAVREDHIQIVKLLLDADIKRISHPTLVPSTQNLVDGLHAAASNNNTEIMKILLEGRKAWIKETVNAGGSYGRYSRTGKNIDILDTGDYAKNNNTPLHIAAYNGYTDIARLLVQAGASAMALNRDDKTPIDLAREQEHGSLAEMLYRIPELHDAIRSDSHPPDMETIRRLADEEQSINVKHPYDGNPLHSHDGYTPLHGAVRFSRQGHADVVQALLDAGADIYLTDKTGATALDIALKEGHGEIAEILRNAGTPINVGTKSSLESAVSDGHTEMVRIITEYLIEDGRRSKRPSIYRNINFNINFNSDDRRSGATIDDVTPGHSLLHVAAANGYTEIARLLVQAGVYVMAKNNDHKTPVDLAHEHGHEDLAQMLESALALREAAAAGDAETVRQLLAAGVPTDAQDGRGATALYSVVETYLEPARATEGHMEVIRLLIQAGARVDATTRWGGDHPRLSVEFGNTNPLHVAAMAGQAEIVELLVEAGKHINGYPDFRTHRNLNTALTLALRESPNEKVARLLIQAGADVNAPVRWNAGPGDTPLLMVAGMGEHAIMSVNIAEALINAGANIGVSAHPITSLALGSYGTPLHKAASVNHVEMVELLLQHGADINAEDRSENSPLHLAIYAGHGDLARLLIEAGADVQARNHAGNTPVQMAAFAGLPEVIKLLVDAGSPVNLQDQVGDTPLHDAVLQGQAEAARVLLEAGADVNAANNAGHTPLELARQQGHENVAAVLQAAGR